MAKQNRKQRQEIVHEAMDRRQRRTLLAEINAAYGRLKASPEAWKEELAERSAWDTAVGDGMDRLSRPLGRGEAGRWNSGRDDN